MKIVVIGGRVEERSPVPLGQARLGRIGLDERLRRSRTRAGGRRSRAAARARIPHPPTEAWGSMKRILCSQHVATLPFGCALADAPKSKNAKLTLVYQHDLPNGVKRRSRTRHIATPGAGDGHVNS